MFTRLAGTVARPTRTWTARQARPTATAIESSCARGAGRTAARGPLGGGAEMKHDLTSPCNECPFRRKHPAGWLGPWEPDDFTTFCMSPQYDGAFACHQTVKRGDPEGEQAQQCAGMVALMNNTCKLSRDPRRAAHQKVVGEREDVFANLQEFLQHHKRESGDEL